MSGRNSLIVRIVVKGSPFKIVEDGSGFEHQKIRNIEFRQCPKDAQAGVQVQ